MIKGSFASCCRTPWIGRGEFGGCPSCNPTLRGEGFWFPASVVIVTIVVLVLVFLSQ